jgi:hypothetical protein
MLTAAGLFPKFAFTAATLAAMLAATLAFMFLYQKGAEEAEILLPANKYCLVVDYRGSCSKVMLM